MSYTLVGSSLYVNDRGKMFSKEAGSFIPVQTKETEAEDRYVERNLKGGMNSAKGK